MELLTQKYSSHLKGDKSKFILKPNISDCGPRTQIQVTLVSVFLCGDSLVKFS